MIAILRLIFTGRWPCAHQWETIRAATFFEKEGDAVPIGRFYDLRCSKCGNIKGVKCTS